MGKCVFNRKWLSDAKFSWVKEFKGDKHKAMCCVYTTNTKGTLVHLQLQSVLMTTFLHKERSSSCDQRSESGPSCAEVNNDEFCVPPPPLLTDVKDVAHWRILWEKLTCSLLSPQT